MEDKETTVWKEDASVAPSKHFQPVHRRLKNMFLFQGVQCLLLGEMHA